MKLAPNFAQPVQFHLELLDDQVDHPNGLVIRMADLLPDIAQRCFLAREFRLQKFSSAVKLPVKYPRVCLPGKRDPGEKERAIALPGPFFTFEGAGEGSASFRSCSKHAAFGTGGRSTAFSGTNQLQPRELLDGVVDLRPRNTRPVADLTAFKLEISLVAVHGPFGEQAQQNKIRRREREAPLTCAHRAPSDGGSSTTIDIVRRANAGCAPVRRPP